MENSSERTLELSGLDMETKVDILLRKPAGGASRRESTEDDAFLYQSSTIQDKLLRFLSYMLLISFHLFLAIILLYFLPTWQA